ncbi:MAG: DUF433 domain-containing protein [Polyangiaceae bacterium]|nr:DUF433 domain-containing protein [Polyangiaceae bacterium]MCE7891299.1 DUF433 domain-containing protein [Sorangiineae bacterium PRO1]
MASMSLPIVLVPHPHVRVDAKVLGGSPHVADTRIPVRRLYAFYKNGARVETILKRYPQLDPAKVFDALAFALDNLEVIEADLELEREMLERTGARAPGSRNPAQVELPFGEPVPATLPAARSRGRGGSGQRSR